MTTLSDIRLGECYECTPLWGQGTRIGRAVSQIPPYPVFAPVLGWAVDAELDRVVVLQDRANGELFRAHVASLRPLAQVA